MLYYKNYFWKNGRPSGKQLASVEDNETVFKIISDPYFKHITIEVYRRGKFSTVIYDTHLLDFRLLKQEIPPSWQKIEDRHLDGATYTLVRDHNDRLAWIETYVFEKEVCKSCKVHSPHGLLLSTHQIYYTSLGDPFDGIELFDSWGNIVMRKKYSITPSGEFDQVLEENWLIDAF